MKITPQNGRNWQTGQYDGVNCCTRWEITLRPICIEEGCDSPAVARGLCDASYRRRKRNGTLPPIPCPVPDCVNESSYTGRPCRVHLDEFADAGMKWCSNPECDNPLKPLEYFSLSRRRPDGRTHRCKTCISIYSAQNCTVISSRTAENHARKMSINPGYRHGISAERYWKMWSDQDGRCAICLQCFDRTDGKPNMTTAQVDHDHQHACAVKIIRSAGCPDCVRSLLCRGCNIMLGQAHDDPAILRRWKPSRARPQHRIDAAIEYLEKWHAIMAERGIRPSVEDALWQDVFGALGRLITEMA